MATYSQAVDFVILQLQSRTETSLTANVQLDIQNAIKHYETTRFWFNEARASFTVSSTLYYPWSTVAADMVGLDQMTVTVNGNVYEVEERPYSYINAIDLNPTTTKGYPQYFAKQAQQFRIYPLPDTVYQVDIDYQKKLTTLSNTADTNAWTTDAFELITARAVATTAMRLRDFDTAMAYQKWEGIALARLLSQTEQFGTTGRISPGY